MCAQITFEISISKIRFTMTTIVHTLVCCKMPDGGACNPAYFRCNYKCGEDRQKCCAYVARCIKIDTLLLRHEAAAAAAIAPGRRQQTVAVAMVAAVIDTATTTTAEVGVCCIFLILSTCFLLLLIVYGVHGCMLAVEAITCDCNYTPAPTNPLSVTLSASLSDCLLVEISFMCIGIVSVIFYVATSGVR